MGSNGEPAEPALRNQKLVPQALLAMWATIAPTAWVRTSRSRCLGVPAGSAGGGRSPSSRSASPCRCPSGELGRRWHGFLLASGRRRRRTTRWPSSAAHGNRLAGQLPGDVAERVGDGRVQVVGLVLAGAKRFARPRPGAPAPGSGPDAPARNRFALISWGGPARLHDLGTPRDRDATARARRTPRTSAGTPLGS